MCGESRSKGVPKNLSRRRYRDLLMNISLLISYIFKAGFCYGIFRYSDDMFFQTLGIFLALGFFFELVDRLKNGNIIKQ